MTSAYKEPRDTFESGGIILRTERLGRTVSGRAIVQDVSIEVGQGDVLGIVGPSGAGKSSLLRFGPDQRGERLDDGRIDELLRQVGLDGFAARAVDHLSGGEAQRVAFARAMANSPNVLLLDEPTSALDDLAKREVETVIRDVVRASHLTCLIVTHDLKSAARLADRILVLEGGRVKRFGPLQEVLDVEANP